MATKRVKIRHEETGLEASVVPKQARSMTSRGWTLVDDGNKEEAAENAAPEVPETGTEEER